MKLDNVIFKRKIYRDILNCINKHKISWGSKLSVELNQNTSNVLLSIYELKRLGLIENQERIGNKRDIKYKSKKIKYCKLTDDGITVVKLLTELQEFIKKVEKCSQKTRDAST